MLAANRTLRSLCVGDASFGDSGAVLLSEGLRDNRSLQLLDLSSRGIGPSGAVALAHALCGQQGPAAPSASSAAGAATGEGGSGDGAPVDATGSREAAGGARSPPTGLQTLDLSLNPLGCGGAAALAPSIGGLCHVNFSGCDISAEGCHALGAAAGSSPAGGGRLRTLDLSGNPLGPAGGLALAEGLAAAAALGPASLEELNLDGTAVADAAVEALARALGGASTASASASLRKLDVSRCALVGSAPAAVVRQVCAGPRAPTSVSHLVQAVQRGE